MASSQSSSEEKSTKGKRNLMSVVESLHPVSFLDPTPPGDSCNRNSGGPSGILPTESPQLPTGLNQNTDAEMSTQDETARCEESERTDDRDGDVITNILRLLYKVSSSNPIESIPQGPHLTPPENDETLLQMQHPPKGSKAGMQSLLQSYTKGTSEFRSILDNDVNLIYECKLCRGMFRTLPSLIRHKKEYCKNTGLVSSLMDRSTNSTQEEDTAFQRVLDILHPPETSLEMDLTPIPNHPLQNQTSDSIDGLKTVVKNLQPVRLKLITSSGMLTSHTQTISNSNAKQVILSPDTIASSSNGKNLKIFLASQFQPPTASSSSSGTSQEKRYICPICGKPMSERKSVRRHLVNVHLISQIDALKMMNSPVRPQKPKPKVNQTPMITVKPGSHLRDLYVESVKLGPNRIIHVLPENFALSSIQCPVCNRELCRKTNVRRHILEAHNLIIKNERKYFQLKEIAAKNMSNSPSLRGLRFLFTANSSNSLISQANRPLPKPSATSTSETSSRPIPILPLVSAASQMKSGGHLSLNKVTFVPSNPAPALTKLHIAPATLSSSSTTPLSNDTKPVDKTKEETEVAIINVSTPNQSNEGTPVQEETDSPGSSNKEKLVVLQILDYECSPCNKTFSRRQTFKNHMSSFHKLSGEDFEQKYAISDTTSTHACAFSDEGSDSDTEPPRKLRKLSAIVTPKELKTQDSTLNEALPQAEISTDAVTNVNGSIDPHDYEAVPLATTSTILSSSAVVSDNVSMPQKEKVAVLTQNFVRRRFPLENASVPRTSTVTPLRPFIKVELRNSVVAAKASEPSLFLKSTQSVSAPPKKSRPIATKASITFDFAKLVCYACDKTFSTQPDLKNHLLGIHSFSTEEALAACYDCSDVNKEAQEEGIANGFDITQAKCLMCDRLYFSRENLAKHLSRMHHLDKPLLEELRASFTPKEESSVIQEVNEATSKASEQNSVRSLNVSSKSMQSATSLLQTKTTVSTCQTPAMVTAPSTELVNATTLRSPASAKNHHQLHYFSKARAMQALKTFPKECINPVALRCVKCRHRYQKMWDLKMHLLKHLEIGLFVCRYCKNLTEEPPAMIRSSDLVKHLAENHNIRVNPKNRDYYFSQCRVNLKSLWEAYGLPVGKVN